MVDRDIGEIFFYFMLIKYIRPYCRVVVSNAITEEECEHGRLEGWQRWESLMMGITNLTYHACQSVTWAKEISMGNKRKMKNNFGQEL